MIITREQAHNLADDKTYGDWEGNALGVDEVIDTIYDSFESQTCNNCNYFGEYTYEIPGAEDFTDTATGCKLLRLRNSDTLLGGCSSKFTSKELT